jgi:hypothetical protein
LARDEEHPRAPIAAVRAGSGGPTALTAHEDPRTAHGEPGFLVLQT